MEKLTSNENECLCFVHHAITPEHRAQVVKSLEYFRRVSDPVGITLAAAQLTGDCPARREVQSRGGK